MATQHADFRVSVAMATYNGERYLSAQLESIALQRLLPAEIVICDDASTDSTVRIAEEFAKLAPVVVRIHRSDENIGWQDRFLQAASLCENVWIAFCDQDDIWLPDKLQKLAEVAVRVPEARLIIHSALIVGEDLEPIGGRLPDIKAFEVRRPLHNYPFATPAGFACCLQRSLLTGVPLSTRPPDHNIPNRRMAHDQFIYHLANIRGSVAYVPDVLALYRRHPAAAMVKTGTRYGASLRERVKGIVSAGAERYRFHSSIVLGLAGYFRTLSAHLPEEREQIERGAEFYKRLSTVYGKRARLYESRTRFPERLRTLSGLLLDGAYTSHVGQLGMRGFAKDLVSTLWGGYQ